MSQLLRVALVDPNDATRESAKQLLLGMDTVWLEAETSRYEFFADIISQTSPDICMVAIDADPTKGLALLRDLSESSPDCALLAMSSSTDGQLILQAMRAGAREFLAVPLVIEELVGALERIRAQKGGGEGGAKRACQTIAVAGATGGAGTTSIAVNVGSILASESDSMVALVDLDLAIGVADVFLDAIPDYTIVDVAQNVSRLDFSLLKRSLTKHASGLYLLPRPVQLQDAELVTPESLQRVLGLLKATFTHLILDLSKSFNPVDIRAMELADDIILVTQLDLPGLRNTVRLLTSLEAIDGLIDKVKVVVNRAGLDEGQISLKKAQDTIGRDIFWQIPNNYRTMVEMRNNGVPLIEQAPKAAITQAFVEFTHALTGKESHTQADSESGARSRWLAFWQKNKAGK